ncbi:MAG: hypothetical protein AAF969_06685 [Bacteroidota bacterium]
MRKIRTYILLAFGVITLMACSEEKIVDDVQATVGRGLILRTVGTIGDSFSISDTGSVWGKTLEVQDIEGGTLLTEIKLFVSFTDNTIEDGDPDFSADEVEMSTFSASAFAPGPFGFPRGDVSASYAEALAATGVDFDNVAGGDAFNFRLEAVLSDGRVFTNRLAGTVANGSFFSSPFAYTSPIVCPPTPPTPGDWTIDFQDSFGDGWNNAALTVDIDGTSTDYTLAAGSASTEVFTVPADAEVISIVFVSGDFDEEVTAQVTSANGNVIVDLQPSPTAGAELIDYCLGNL